MDGMDTMDRVDLVDAARGSIGSDPTIHLSPFRPVALWPFRSSTAAEALFRGCSTR
jgi:hypothetical protein